MALTLHPFDHFLGKQFALGEWPATAKVFYFCSSVPIFHLEDRRQLPTHPLFSCLTHPAGPADLHLFILRWISADLGSHCSTCNLWRMHSSTAARILCKKGHSEVEREGHQNPTRDLENKENEAEMIPPILCAMTRLKCVGFSVLKGLRQRKISLPVKTDRKRTQSYRQQE